MLEKSHLHNFQENAKFMGFFPTPKTDRVALTAAELHFSDDKNLHKYFNIH